VTAVIPTACRPEVVRAVQSARQQDYEADIEVIVVVDRAGAVAPSVLRQQADQLLFSDGGGAAAARNLGAAAASTEIVAFLDDDDEWDTAKTARQAPEVTKGAGVVSSRVRMIKDGLVQAHGVPHSIIGPRDMVDNYLFRRRRPGAGRASLYTSTLMAHASVIKQVPWRDGLRRHQDWDWLIRCQRAGYSVVQVPDELVSIHVGSAGSISANADWESSLSWAVETLEDPRVRSDFLAAQTLRYALHARSRSGMFAVLNAIQEGGAYPSPGPLAIGLAGVLSRSHLEKMMSWLH